MEKIITTIEKQIVQKEKIQELIKKYNQLISTISSNKLTPYSAGHCDALTYVVKELGDLTK